MQKILRLSLKLGPELCAHDLHGKTTRSQAWFNRFRKWFSIGIRAVCQKSLFVSKLYENAIFLFNTKLKVFLGGGPYIGSVVHYWLLSRKFYIIKFNVIVFFFFSLKEILKIAQLVACGLLMEAIPCFASLSGKIRELLNI